MICYAFPLAHEAKLLLKACAKKESFRVGQLPCTLGELDGRSVLVALVVWRAFDINNWQGHAGIG